MSERILKALMQLFAIIADPRITNRKGRAIVESFLNQQLNESIVGEYLKLFDDYYALYQKKQTRENKKEKNISLSSVKVLKICTQINRELSIKQKVIVIVRLFEFAREDNKVSNQELEFIYTVSEIFHFPNDQFELLKDFVLSDFIKQIPKSAKILLIDGNITTKYPEIRHLYQDSFDGKIWVLNFSIASIYLLRNFSNNELQINSQLSAINKVYVLTQGAVIRDSKMTPIYYSDIVNTYQIGNNRSIVQFEAKNVEYEFKGGKKGLHSCNFVEESGRLVGIMGASGTGKSTLLNILNGSYTPSSGNVTINGIDIHKQRIEVDGLIGFVAQDDLLIEELSIYQNLYYNAQLCFEHLNSFQINRKVLKVLQNLGLLEIQDMVVGSPLNKKISGGQRKRLNIALELIREPAILFLDEPTSGLSSRDSENIMDLLKELTLKGKLVFAVIHQPSSDIFKMLDKLFILDQGGYLIYNGNPVDSIMYFKSKAHEANKNNSECGLCGNINPEQIFNIVESKVLDEYGNITLTRKKTPQEWFKYFNKKRLKEPDFERLKEKPQKNLFKKPNKFKQFSVFVKRDVLSKISNKQYLVINILEAPILAFILSFIIKYYNLDKGEYLFINNSNIPIYIFISVIVAIFIGLTVSAEEIIKDRKILKRERFLNLSRTAYLFSKIAILLFISAFQAMLFTLIGNSILEIKDMYFQYWLVLFSTWFSANLIGLIISDSFDTVVTIYILIPFLVIPQLILSGIIVPFDKINPKISSPSNVPWYGEIITARWAYEALAVYQFTENKYEKEFYPYNKVLSNASFKKNYWIKTLENKLNYCKRNYKDSSKQVQVEKSFNLLKNELQKELKNNKKVHFKEFNILNLSKLNDSVIFKTTKYLEQLKMYYLKQYNNANKLKDDLINSYLTTDKKKAEFLRRKNTYTNKNLSLFVKNTNSIDRVIEANCELIQKIDPIYQDPQNSFVKAHFYAPQKNLLGLKIKTFHINIIIIWIFNIILYLILQFRLLRKLIGLYPRIKR